MEKYKINPNVIDIGRAGNALRKIANRSNVKHKPYKEREGVKIMEDSKLRTINNER